MIITEEEQAQYEITTRCWICGGKTIDNDMNLRKVRDHCHFTGKYRGAAHNKCNLKLKVDKTIPLLFHNGRGYDFHLFVRNLGRVGGRIKTIAKNEEQYISIDKNVCVGEKNTWKLRFLDFCGFLQAKLVDLVKNLPKEEFKILSETYDQEKFDLLLRKGVFPYDWYDDMKKLDETELPPIEEFYSSLEEDGISKEDYEHTKKVWQVFKIKTMREYHDLYCRCITAR